MASPSPSPPLLTDDAENRSQRFNIILTRSKDVAAPDIGQALKPGDGIFGFRQAQQMGRASGAIRTPEPGRRRGHPGTPAEGRDDGAFVARRQAGRRDHRMGGGQMVDVPVQGLVGAQMTRQTGRNSPRATGVSGIDVETAGKVTAPRARHRKAQPPRDVDE
jgi:hypothetical protein